MRRAEKRRTVTGDPKGKDKGKGDIYTKVSKRDPKGKGEEVDGHRRPEGEGQGERRYIYKGK